MEAGKNSVIYMGLVPGPNKADNICGKTKVTGTMLRGFTVFRYLLDELPKQLLLTAWYHILFEYITLLDMYFKHPLFLRFA
jgi:hypothetical protein